MLVVAALWSRKGKEEKDDRILWRDRTGAR